MSGAVARCVAWYGRCFSCWDLFKRTQTMPPTLELRSKQHVALTPRLQQSVRLLQLSSLEFQHELRQALDSNPFLEYDEPVPDGETESDRVKEVHGVGQDAAETV